MRSKPKPMDRLVDLTTDDAGGISALDFALAVEMEKAASPPGALTP